MILNTGKIFFSSLKGQARIWGPRSLPFNGSRRVKRLGGESSHSLPSNAEVKNAWNYTFITPYAFFGVVLSWAREQTCIHVFCISKCLIDQWRYSIMNIGLTNIIAGYLNSHLLRANPLARSSDPCSPLPLSQPSFRVTTQKTHAAGLSETMVPVYKPMRQHILQNSETHSLCCENLKSAVNSSYSVLPNENFIIHT